VFVLIVKDGAIDGIPLLRLPRLKKQRWKSYHWKCQN